MTKEPDAQTVRRARKAQQEETEDRAGGPARQWREEAEDIARANAGQASRAAEMGDRVEPTIPVTDPQDDPGVVQDRPVGEAQEAQTGRHHAENG
ncbi:MAG: hypothetical protein IE926_15940 [Micrococcales bacterium]|nr:hypothetical protein [Micrococcales bacterium]